MQSRHIGFDNAEKSAASGFSLAGPFTGKERFTAECSKNAENKWLRQAESDMSGHFFTADEDLQCDRLESATPSVAEDIEKTAFSVFS